MLNIDCLGMNQLLWHYAELEKQKCVEDSGNNNITTIENLTGGRKNNRVSKQMTICKDGYTQFTTVPLKALSDFRINTLTHRKRQLNNCKIC